MNDRSAILAHARQDLEKLGFATPADAALEIHYKLARHIEQLIGQQNGWISFADFMQQALYAPGLGYYAAGSHKLGEQGDFITAPEIGSLFAQCLATAVREVLQQLPPTGQTVLELGPGSGRLCFDLLQVLERNSALPQQYYLLEVSPDLRQRQQALLSELPEALQARVSWLEQWPQQFSGVVLANEVLDAMSVQKFKRTADGVLEVGVGVNDHRFVWADRPASELLQTAVAQIEQDLGNELANGYESEYCDWVGPWLQGMAQALTAGAVLLIDYGYSRSEYYLPERDQGTLLCYFQQRTHANPLVLAGLQDITAHVDFTHVARQALAAGFKIEGFTNQANFLLGCGLDQLLQNYAGADTQVYLEYAQQAKKLLMPGEMGERFKVLGLSKQMAAPDTGHSIMGGFKVRDFSHRLIPAN